MHFVGLGEDDYQPTAGIGKHAKHLVLYSTQRRETVCLFLSTKFCLDSRFCSRDVVRCCAGVEMRLSQLRVQLCQEHRFRQSFIPVSPWPNVCFVA